MIHMAVDHTHSSFSPAHRGFRNLAMNPGKRARSPEESGSDRPSKKLTLAIADPTGRPNYRHLSVSSASSSRQPSEDWVQQTGGLTIDSPLYSASDHDHPFTSPSEGNTGDVDMVMDSEESNDVQGRPRLAPIRTTPYSLSKLEPHLPAQHGASNSPRHSYGTRYAEKMQGPTIPPLINVVPATPVSIQHAAQHRVDDRAGSSGLIYSLSQPSTPPSDVVPMAISPVASFAQLASPAVPKRRVVFGPRSNCEKCRAGERHFIHYE